MQHKIIKNLKQLETIRKGDLFNNDKLKPLNRKTAVSIARLLHEGFDGDLRKEPTYSEYRKAQRVIKEFYNNSMGANIKVIRPNKKNRGLYAEKTGLSKKYKHFPVAFNNPNNKLKIKKVKGKKQVVEVGKFVTYDNFYYPSKEDLLLNPEKETQKLKNKMPKKVDSLRIIVGQHTTNAETDIDLINKEIARFMTQYNNAEQWVRGLQVASFSGQKSEPKAKARKRRKNKGRFKR